MGIIKTTIAQGQWYEFCLYAPFVNKKCFSTQVLVLQPKHSSFSTNLFYLAVGVDYWPSAARWWAVIRKDQQLGSNMKRSKWGAICKDQQIISTDACQKVHLLVFFFS